jgi:hypothetical protein
MSDFRNPGFIYRCRDCNQIALDGKVPSPHNFVTNEDPYQEENKECRGHQKPPRKLQVIRIQKPDFVYMLSLRNKDHHGQFLKIDPERIQVNVVYENNGIAPCFVDHCDGVEELSVEIEVENND